MPDFKIPTLPSNLQAGGLTLSVRSTFDLSDYESEVLQQSLGDSFFGHTTLRDYIQYGKGTGEIRGTIGIHEGRERQEDLFEETPTQRNWVHYTLTFTEGARGTSKRHPKWDQTVQALTDVVDPRTAEVQAFWSLPKQTTAFKVALPIPLMGDIPGFSEIQGVRLVQPDPDRLGSELYSLILNHHGDRATFQVVTALVSNLASDVLSRALDLSYSIAKLAFERSDSHA